VRAGGFRVNEDAARGYDHGVFVPLLLMWVSGLRWRSYHRLRGRVIIEFVSVYVRFPPFVSVCLCLSTSGSHGQTFL
jgi:hypothetical protein